MSGTAKASAHRVKCPKSLSIPVDLCPCQGKFSDAAWELWLAIHEAIAHSSLHDPDGVTAAKVIDAHLEPLLSAAQDCANAGRSDVTESQNALLAELEKWKPGR